MSKNRVLVVISSAALWLGAGAAHAQQTCPQTTSPSGFGASALTTDCLPGITTTCTSRTGTVWDTVAGALKLPGSAGNFQNPPGSAVGVNVLFAATADFDRDGWEDIAAADDKDMIFILRNQTTTCGVSPAGSAVGVSTCSGSTTVAPTDQSSTISAAWWNNVANVRASAFRFWTDAAGTRIPLKAAPAGLGNVWNPMAAADFDGDGWTDFAQISYNHAPAAFPAPRFATAARLFLNTRNCRNASNVPCGIGKTCTGQPANGVCTGTGLTNGTPFAATNLSCTATNRCSTFYPTFATYDLRMPAANEALNPPLGPDSGTPVSSIGNGLNSSPTTRKPGDFGPLSRPVTNMQVLDWDGDGDIDILYGHSPGTCVGSLCTTAGQAFMVAVEVWLNDCASSAAWNPATKSCIGHVPQFYRNQTACTGSSCSNPHTLFPSTAHNTTTVAPTFNAGFDYSAPYTHQSPVFAYEDIDKDGDRDLVLGSVGCCSNNGNSQYKLRIYKGTTNNAFTHTLDTANPLILSTSNTTYPGFEGALTGVFVSDFSGDGFADIITGSDAVSYSGSIGGRARYWKHTGNSSTPYGTNWPTCSSAPATCAGCNATCNPNPTTKISESCGSSSCAATPATRRFPDFDNALFLDYDRDPQGTKDVVFTNSASVGEEFYIFPNRATPSVYAACGEIASGTLPLPSTSNELIITGARLSPTPTTQPANTSITYFMSNEEPANWIQASNCTTPPTTDVCVTFPSVTGKAVRWRAVMDSNTTDGVGVCSATGTTTPTLSNVAASYTYTPSGQHYRAGVVVYDGVTYVGSFTQPGDRGHLYAFNARLQSESTDLLWDAAAKLDAQADSSRNIYTWNGSSKVEVTLANSASLVSTFGAANAADAATVITWLRSARFGLGGGTTSKLGAVISSTPAVLSPPFRPNWYSYLPAADKAAYDTFASTNASRIPLVLFGSKDGMVHAHYAIARTPLDSRNGREAWAYIPPEIATYMKADSLPGATISSFPDGSPTLLDYRKANGSIATTAIINSGFGGSSITAFDVTNTTPATSPTTNTVVGPTPMWSIVPGVNAGLATSKTAVARVKLGTTETYVAMAGSGTKNNDINKGKVVAGYNLETGALLWMFETMCSLTSDITVFETDDAGESGSPILDGFADRAVFADACGYVYKINPAQDLAGGWLSNAGMGPITLDNANGVARTALFSTAATSGAIGAAREIAGTIGARIDNTNEMVLYFGTGGLEASAANQQNFFFAVRVVTGAVRSKVAGQCAGPSGPCEKFYGGVVLTPNEVITQQTTDAVVGGSTCDFGRTRVIAYNQNGGSNFGTPVFTVDQIEGATLSAVSGPLYGDAGALYFATLSGDVARIGTPRVGESGGDSTAGYTGGMATVGDITASNTKPFALMGWRVVL